MDNRKANKIDGSDKPNILSFLSTKLHSDFLQVNKKPFIPYRDERLNAFRVTTLLRIYENMRTRFGYMIISYPFNGGIPHPPTVSTS
jgi:hypothetical protein